MVIWMTGTSCATGSLLSHWNGTARTSSQANFITAMNGASSGTLNLRRFAEKSSAATGREMIFRRRISRSNTHTLNGSLGSEVSVTLNVTFACVPAIVGS